MKIYCLNLERATERRKMIEEEWIKKHGFNIEFFKAFDRRALENGNYIFPYDEEKTIKLIKRPLSEGEIACATSHILLLKHALEMGYDEIVVMEDDIRPTEFTSVIAMENAIATCKKEFPHSNVLIMHHDDGRAKTIESKGGINLLSFPPYGYRLVWLNKKAMKQLIQDLGTMSYPADCLWILRFVPMRTLSMTEKPLGFGDAMQSYIGGQYRKGNSILIP